MSSGFGKENGFENLLLTEIISLRKQINYFMRHPFPDFNVDCGALVVKSLLVVSTEIISRISHDAVFNIDIGVWGAQA